jgi:hypothetical protein
MPTATKNCHAHQTASHPHHASAASPQWQCVHSCMPPATNTCLRPGRHAGRWIAIEERRTYM